MLGINLYSIKEVAEILKVTERTVQTYIRDERLKAQKIGRMWKITEDNLKKFIKGE